MKYITKSLTVFLGLTVCGISGYLLYLLFRQDDEDDLIDTYAQLSKFKTLEIKVPKDMVRALIGRNGKSIKLIQEQSNTRINFKDREGSEEKICVIRGSIEACNIAENLIQEFINNQPILESEDIWVPMGCVGKIIGRCGEKITEIRSLSGAKLTVNDDEKGFTLKRITIKGTKEQINVAKSLIDDVVEQTQQSQQRMEASLSKREPRLPPKSPENLKVVESPKVERMSHVPGQSDAQFEVYVSALVDPSRFWLQIVGPKATELDCLVEEMTEYYNKQENQYLHRLNNISKGDLVASLFQYDNKWYRAEVLIVHDVDPVQVELYYVDYGDIEVVLCNNLCELRTDFLRLHFQAIECFLARVEMQRQLARFWEIEECSHIKPVSKEEHACEEHFLKNTRRAADGRFIVSIPFKENPENLGDSKQQAQKRFWYLEKKLNSNNSFRERYCQFMAEYENLGHMTLAENKDDTVSYYMPHHGIIREESLTTKLRVVFDASAATSNGLSLNDLQMVGPTIQDDLLSIILRFRKHAYVISADITKMYRQVLIDPNQRSLQKILWRKNSSDPLQTYILNTVTYGTTSAPYLAIRCLVETAHNVRETYPDIAEIIEHDFYVDDLLTGANTVESAICIGKQISSALISSGFELRKWRSNNCYITQNLSNDNYQHKIEQALDFGEVQSTKTLGLVWSCDLDVLKYKINANTNNARITKRSILSNTAQIFNPLGLLSPCTIIAKMLLQKLWAEKISWDESVPLTLHTIWMNFRRELPLLNDLKIQRHIICKNATRIELHGFSDSSLNAYGSSLYIRSENKIGEVFVHLLCAKSKVAPLKSLTIPRLELCGALILARLVNKALKSLKINFHKCTFWSDSTIVLGWLKTSPSLLKPFVNNRVAEIQDLTDVNNWRHVSTKDNPADLLSRGVNPSEIKNSSLWWYGPPWLLENENNWPNYNVSVETLPELRTQVQTFLSTNKNDLFQFERFSNLNRIKRTMAFILRFRHNCQISKSLRRLDSLTSSDIKEAFEVLIQLAQKEMFAREHNSLRKGEPLHSKSKLLNLNPFIDSHGIIRVGGRLRHSNYPFEKKHPILLSHKHHLTKLIFNHEHIRLLHAGPQLLLSSIREEFWSTGGRNLAKGTVRKCVVCFRHNSRQIQPIMGDLPKSRLHSGIPFNFTGVDYAGPFSLKERKGRGSKFTKSWICLFVCFATKAIHLELVSDISTESFILALRRFTARRGKPAHIYSDNGKNFVGANTELKSLGSFLVDNTNKLENLATAEGITWHFIPAYSPHFGGIWEAGVKATKHHLKRVMGNAFLTFEEFYSLLVQIESILNSRPLSPLSSDPNDLIPLTPAHFLVGRTLTSVPDPDVQHIPDSRLSRYQRIQQLKQHFWVRWSKEYIAEMQVRSRWKNNQGQLKEGAMVLVKEDNLPPLKWRLGRITQLYPGEDGTARVAQIQTEKGMIRRAYSKICPLPEEELPIERQPFQGGGHVNN